MCVVLYSSHSNVDGCEMITIFGTLERKVTGKVWMEESGCLVKVVRVLG